MLTGWARGDICRVLLGFRTRFLYRRWILCYLSSTLLKTQQLCYRGTDEQVSPTTRSSCEAQSRRWGRGPPPCPGCPCSASQASARMGCALLRNKLLSSSLAGSPPRPWQRDGGQSCFSVLRFYLFLGFQRYARRKLEVYESGCVLKIPF